MSAVATDASQRSSAPVAAGASTRGRHVAGGVLAIAAVLALSACTAAPPVATPPVHCDAQRAANLDCGLYTAVSATTDGAPATWLPTMPLRLWFEPLNGRRTAILDGPLNTADVPVVAQDGLLWTGGEGSFSLVGCTGPCLADRFMSRLTGSPAHYRVSSAGIDVTAHGEAVRFAPTAAPAPDLAGSGCDTTGPDDFRCPHLLSVTATDGGTRIDRLRTVPVGVELHGSGARRTAVVRDGATTSTLELTVRRGLGVSQPAAAADLGGDGFVRSVLGGRVEWRPHGTSVLLVAGDRTIELEAAPAATVANATAG